jgi:SAM-dependent methyltransferase
MKLDRKLNVNTKQYWNRRYLTIQYNIPAIGSVDKFFRHGFLPEDRPITVLEIGCGTATHYPFIHKKYPLAKFIGAEISNFATEFNKKNYDFAEFMTIDIEKENLPTVYDYIISAHTFEHLTDPMAATEKCLNAAREGVIISVPYKESWSYDHEHMHTFSEFEPYTTHENYVIEFECKGMSGGIYFQFKGKAPK